MRLALIATAAIALSPMPALAQTVPPLPPRATVTPPRPADEADPARVRAATRVLMATHIEAQYDQAFGRLIPIITKQTFDSIKDNVKVPVALRNFLADESNLATAQREFAERVFKGFRARYPALIAATAREYAQAFTADELDALAAFYESTLGQKTLATLPALQGRLFNLGADMGRVVGEEAITQTLEHLLPKQPPTRS